MNCAWTEAKKKTPQTDVCSSVKDPYIYTVKNADRSHFVV